jgi:hypothetical protein
MQAHLFSLEQAGKIKNLLAKPSIADAVNVKYVGGKAKAKAAAFAAKGKNAQTPEQAAEDAVAESFVAFLLHFLLYLRSPCP